MDFTKYAAYAALWVSSHPVEAGLLFLAFMNVVMAQIPKPKISFGLTVYNLISRTLLIVSTHKDEPGTFTWPWLIKIFLEQPKPATTTNDPAPPAALAPLVDPKPASPEKDGDDHGQG
jgi:hypothetical protein